MNPLEYITFINFLEIESEELGMYDVMSILGKIFDDHFDMKVVQKCRVEKNTHLH